MRYVHLRKLGLNFIHLFLVERAGLRPAYIYVACVQREEIRLARNEAWLGKC